MKLKNDTHWRSDQLRALIQCVALAEVDPAHRKALRVHVVYKRKGQRLCGLATVGGRWVKLYIEREAPDLVQFAHACAHELAHNRGKRHRDMGTSPRYAWDTDGKWRELYGWAASMPLERTPERPKADGQLTRYLSVLARQEGWQTKLKRAQTALKKLTRQRRYYERALLAAGKLPGGQA